MSGIYFLRFLKLIFLFLPFEKLHHSLFYLTILLFISVDGTVTQNTFFSPCGAAAQRWPWPPHSSGF